MMHGSENYGGIALAADPNNPDGGRGRSRTNSLSYEEEYVPTESDSDDYDNYANMENHPTFRFARQVTPV